jgi:DNA polymerase-3 subunit alpha
MAALLTSVRDDKDKSALYLNECRRLGIKVLPPDVNSSDANFTPVGTDIRFGLTAIRNVGANVVEAIVATRADKGRYASFEDFLRKVPVVVCNKRTIESLIKAGAFDDLGHTRRGLVAVHEAAVDAVVSDKRQEAIGQDSLFGGVDDVSFGSMTVKVPDIPEWDKVTLLGFEREMLGLYVSSHPLMGLEHVLSASADCTIGVLLADESRGDNTPITISGLITAVQRKVTRKGDTWAIITVEDLEGAINVMLFPSTYQLHAPMLVEDTIVVVKGKVRRNDDVPEISGSEVSVPDVSPRDDGPVVISLSAARCTPPTVELLKDVLATHPGVAEVHLRLTTASSTKVLRLDQRLRVSPSPSLMADLKALLGPACLSR